MSGPVSGAAGARPLHGTFKQKLAWMTVLVSTGALVVAGTAFMSYHLLASRRAIARNLAVQAETIGLNSVSALVFDDERSAEESLAALRADRNIVTAAIYGTEGNLFAAYAARPEDEDGIDRVISARQEDTVRFQRRTADAFRTIVTDGKRRGTVHLVYSLNELFADLAGYLGITIVVIGVSILTARFAASRLQRTFSEPVARLAAAAEVVSRTKDYTVRVEATSSTDEFGMFIDTFNEMLAQIQAREREVEAGQSQVQQLNEELEQRVLQRTAELDATNKELEAFTYSVSHDLRAPLRRIDGFANLLGDKCQSNLPDEGRHFLARIREGTQQMGQLIDDLLNLARLGRKDVSIRTTDLSPIVSRVADALSRDSNGRVIDWRLQPLPTVACDPALIEVVFTNLLSNAVKYTKNREQTTIEVGAIQDDGGFPVFFVRDNGVGFSMKYAHKLFGPFQRLHRAEDFEGTGIGLATVQRIIHKHKGAVWAESDVDAGASFYFTIDAQPGAGARQTLSKGETR